MVLFLLERVAPSPIDQVWRRLTTWERHGDVVPLTRVAVVTPPPTREGTVFVARSGIGPVAFDDPMEVVTWRPPTDGLSGMFRLLKHGTFVTGWAEIAVYPYGNEGSRVVWQEELRVRHLPTAFDRPLAWAARWMFGRALNGLLKPP